MPWSSNADLPKTVRSALPAAAQTRWRQVANERLNSGDSESSAIRQAWHVVGRGWKRPKSGDKWVRKEGHVTEKNGIPVLKYEDDEQRMVWGWASVSMIKDELLIDTQQDAIDENELVKMTTDFMEEVRAAHEMHKGERVGTVIHSLPLTHELAKSLGIDIDQAGWIVGVKVHDDDTWAKVKSGELAAFSIGGRAERVEI